MEHMDKSNGGVGQTDKPAGEGGTPGFLPVNGRTNKPGGEGGTPGFMAAEEEPGESEESSS
jgi:hypothetical protein